MTASIVELSAQVVAAVNAASAAKSDENVVVELEALLKELGECEKQLDRLVPVVDVIPGMSRPGKEFERCRRLLTDLQGDALADAIGAARSEEGRALVRELRSAVSDLEQRTTSAWNDLRQELRAEVRVEFLGKLSGLPAFASIAEEILQDNRVVQEVLASNRLPSADRLSQAKAARARIEVGLTKLQALLPEDVQRPLERCFRGELRLVDVKPAFLEWIRKHGLKDDFTVQAS
jgi:hypothetical protein